MVLDHVQRIEILELMWTPVGSRLVVATNCMKSTLPDHQDEIRLQCLRQAQSSGDMDKMMAMVDRSCRRIRPERLRTVPHLHNNDDINMLDKLLE
ncbi:hypothetical protein ACNKHX_26920 [Shigella flexneri]